MLKTEHISKQFSGVVVLDDISVEFEAGKVNALVGENGAGKSTLMNILAGVYTEYDGQIIYNGNHVRFSNPREAADNGIAIIHQELNLVPYLSIRENIFLGRELVNKWGFLQITEMRKKTEEIINRLNLNLDPDTLVHQLKVGQQQVIEIAKALLLKSNVIIMDEPTSAISDQEVEVLFRIIEDLKKEGRTIIYISHKMEKLFRMAERYHVLRDGKFIESGDMRSINQDYLVSKMVGREINLVKKESNVNYKKEVLTVSKLTLKNPEKAQDPILKNISLNLKAGEVVGIYGLMGAGRTELMESLFGLHSKRVVGEIKVNQQLVHFRSPKDAINAGIALVPEDRKKDGLILGLDVKTNLSLAVLKDIEKYGLLNREKEKKLADKYTNELKIKTTSNQQLAQKLSGGNQQKIVLSKWLATNPRILLLDEPTRGIDINAKNEIYKLILRLANNGLGIIMVSSELPEILAISDRILVMSEGNLTAEFNIGSATEEKILDAAIPKSI